MKGGRRNMIRIIDVRLIIEKYDTHEKYYPKVVRFDCVDEYPFTNVPQATIEIIPNSSSGNPESVSHVEFDDIVRLQISIRYYRNEKHLWVDLFEGRIENQSKELSRNNTIQLNCVGHLVESQYALLTADKTYTNVDATVILQELVSSRLSRIAYSSTHAESGLIIPEYNAKAQQVYMSDVFAEMEKVSGYKRIIDVKPTYTAGGNLSTCYLTWKQFSTTPTDKYKAIEGTNRLLSATFDVIGEEVRTFRYVKGGTDAATNTQYSGNASDAAAIAKYGNRYAVDTFAWIKSNSLCTTIASGLVTDSKLPYVAGQVVLEGTPDAKKGDLVTVKIPSLEVNGLSVSGNYAVHRVRHALTEQGYKTTLDLEKIKKNEYDYIMKNITQKVNTCYKNQVK
jgi:hypothetical protein